MSQKKKIYIWGTGYHAVEHMNENIYSECEILGFIDNYKTKDVFFDYPVLTVDEISKNYDYIVVSIEEPNAVLQQCEQMGIDTKKVILVYLTNVLDECYIEKYKETYDSLRMEIPKVYELINKIKAESDIKNYVLYTCGYDEIDKERLIGKSSFSGEYYREYIRYRTFELAAEELRKLEDQNWSVAELGVFRGAFSRLINAKFKDKKLYMFDTFEGFDSEESAKELEMGNCDGEFIKYFSDNNVDRVIKNMPYKDKCIIKKGLFPKTSEGLENERYGFVSLDVDFGDSTLSGMEYFYPRLIENGYIFVHDYNHVSLQGVKDAIEKYEKKYDIKVKKIPLCDSNGTLVIVK